MLQEDVSFANKEPMCLHSNRVISELCISDFLMSLMRHQSLHRVKANTNEEFGNAVSRIHTGDCHVFGNTSVFNTSNPRKETSARGLSHTERTALKNHPVKKGHQELAHKQELSCSHKKKDCCVGSYHKQNVFGDQRTANGSLK